MHMKDNVCNYTKVMTITVLHTTELAIDGI